MDIHWRSQKVKHAKSVAFHWNHILSVLSSGYWLWVQNSYTVVWCSDQDTKGCQKYPSIDSGKFIHAVLKGWKWILMFKRSNTLQGVHGISEKERIWIRLDNLRGNEDNGCVTKIDFKYFDCHMKSLRFWNLYWSM